MSRAISHVPAATSGCTCCTGLFEPTGTKHRGLSRRGLLRATGAVAAGVSAFAPRPSGAQTTLAPALALQALLDGNQRFVDQKLTSFSEDLAILKQNTVYKQEPFAAVLSCADSRVPVELLFDQSIGHLFVNRVAGNIATPEIIASLEYGAAVLGTAVIMVLGHGGCGAVKAAMQGKAVPGQISSLFAPIRAAVDLAGGDLELAIRTNAKTHARLLSVASPLLAGLIADGKLAIVAGYYDLATGKVTQLA